MKYLVCIPLVGWGDSILRASCAQRNGACTFHKAQHEKLTPSSRLAQTAGGCWQ
jgi:hypothetical protein